MISDKMKPSLITYTSILQILIKSKRIHNAIEIFEEILSNKMNPDQVLFNVIINGCIFNGKLEAACKFLFESFEANIRLCEDVYRNVLNNLLTNRVMEVNYKNDITLRVCKEMKNRSMLIDYELYHKVLKMIYKSQGKNADYLAKKELEEYKSSSSNFKNSYANNNNYTNSNYNKNYNNNYNNNNNNSNGFNNGRWRK
jgi:pentatricopeptide repeat protein